MAAKPSQRSHTHTVRDNTALSKHTTCSFDNTLTPPIYQTSTYYFENTAQVIQFHNEATKLGRYGRYHNQNWEKVEQQLAALDDCEEALLFPSGMSAISNVLLTFLKQGDRVLFTSKGYRNIRKLFYHYFEKLGIEVIGLDPTDTVVFNNNLKRFLNHRTKIIFVETPSNPHQHLVELDYIRECIDENNEQTLLVVDSTFASPLNFRPMRFGADLVIHSCTKYLAGHSDLIAGSVAGSQALIQKVRHTRNVMGSISDPNTAFLLHRSLATFPMRMQYLNQAGLKVAHYLDQHPQVTQVLYAGLPNHPHYALAQKYLQGYGSVICFDVGSDRAGASDFVDRLTIPAIGTNFGSQYSMVEQIAVFNNFSTAEARDVGISDNTIRLYIGLEDTDRLIDDLEQAL
ncbi:MAG: trans-sulfuration enzyme family protein [bacterium]